MNAKSGNVDNTTIDRTTIAVRIDAIMVNCELHVECTVLQPKST